ncbi:bifunctional protein:[Includes: para-aminobenzoate synthase glutamine amidotransferase component II (ADC synthase); anthranilate synthase component II] [Tepidanaerobacter acetatoxydans Re1]|uniref:Bifunctional protein n=1 Tax=Tepidanaerobacter acetatoxydans (strain DSM 21804 / JCM 16047 / Re1) TaxID=1209989 RepID=F4LWG8_TEPAE|nr:aminodeoxychorismate/anthranilate synthase component II [Tepidanaerobacter acetatoxydans]AEE91766.1 glutamine amidotransferase of anthranilate synthase [Tepidanaerobacter acetatoxydans Re1]CCP26541.1 bifunctional protein:[Includes: para-aminobenzoate synthase glutamine amidotransferase component II (ADC synthase); anthranilate synthase component II] [Tepidanaerobacter acetatoxydans Re1]
MILIIDNHDSFSYNLYQLVGTINKGTRVACKDELTIDEIKSLRPSHIIISSGPGYPKDAGICNDVVAELGREIPLLGVGLGHQIICRVFGATISHAKRLMHGKQSEVVIDNTCLLFQNVPYRIKVALYNSLTAVQDNFPESLKVISETDDGEIMAVKHDKYPIYGVQFHPESILTPDGKHIIQNFLSMTKGALL